MTLESIILACRKASEEAEGLVKYKRSYRALQCGSTLSELFKRVIDLTNSFEPQLRTDYLPESGSRTDPESSPAESADALSSLLENAKSLHIKDPSLAIEMYRSSAVLEILKHNGEMSLSVLKCSIPKPDSLTVSSNFFELWPNDFFRSSSETGATTVALLPGTVKRTITRLSNTINDYRSIEPNPAARAAAAAAA
eukprot:Rmarinus@m.21714